MKKKRKQTKKKITKPVGKKPTGKSSRTYRQSVSKAPLPKKKVRVRKLRYGRIFFVVLFFAILLYLFLQFVHFPIRNLYIEHNTYLSDQEIIDLAGLRDYPGMFSSSSRAIEKRLEHNIYIAKAKVKKRNLREITITVTENIPLFYYKNRNCTVFTDGRETTENLASTVLINYVPDETYEKLVQQIKQVDPMILKRISTLQYDPNNVDEERFLLTMADGNYVYLTLEKFDSINNYVEIMKNIIKTHGNQKGILYLDSGEYFEIMK